MNWSAKASGPFCSCSEQPVMSTAVLYPAGTQVCSVHWDSWKLCATIPTEFPCKQALHPPWFSGKCHPQTFPEVLSLADFCFNLSAEMSCAHLFENSYKICFRKVCIWKAKFKSETSRKINLLWHQVIISVMTVHPAGMGNVQMWNILHCCEMLDNEWEGWNRFHFYQIYFIYRKYKAESIL